MKAALLLLLSLTHLTSAHSRASVKVTPDRNQFFEYEHIAVTCEHLDSEEWTVWRYTTKDLQLSECGSGWGTQTSSTCIIKTVKPSSSGVYWCESNYRDSTRAINITVTDKSVILESPVFPVMQGSDVMLYCKTKDPPNYRLATFYKDDRNIGIKATGHMTILNVSKSNEGAYKCEVKDGVSPISWLFIKADDLDDSLSLTTFPESSQLSEYENLSLTCGRNNNSSFHTWSIKRFTTFTSKLSSCGDQWGTVTSSGCNVSTVKAPDSAIYWCESHALQRSSTVNISVNDNPVILRSPVHPLTVGDNVTLQCKTTTEPFNQSATFFKDGYPIKTEPTGHMTLYHVSKFNEGIYTCLITSTGVSSPISLLIKGEVAGDSMSSGAAQSVYMMVRYVMVSLPYFMSTILMMFRYHEIRQKPHPQHREKSLTISMATPSPAEDDEGLDEDYEPVVTTEHHF